MTAFINCTNANLTIEQVFSALLTKTTGGDWALRTMIVEACATDAIDCENNMVTIEQSVKNCIGIDPSCSKPAIRLGLKKTAFVSALGIPSYVDVATAEAALPAGRVYYDQTSGLIKVTII